MLQGRTVLLLFFHRLRELKVNCWISVSQEDHCGSELFLNIKMNEFILDQINYPLDSRLRWNCVCLAAGWSVYPPGMAVWQMGDIRASEWNMKANIPLCAHANKHIHFVLRLFTVTSTHSPCVCVTCQLSICRFMLLHFVFKPCWWVWVCSVCRSGPCARVLILLPCGKSHWK